MSNGKRPSLPSRVLAAVSSKPLPALPTRAPAPSKIGWTGGGPERTVAKAPGPGTDHSTIERRSSIYTYFTRVLLPGEEIPVLFNGERLWTRVKLTLETAGPVAVGTASQITPVLSGKGQLLPTNREREFIVAKGTRLWIASTSVNRVSVVIEPLPWLEQITGLLGKLLGRTA